MAEKLWGGRFKKEMDKEFEQFSKSIHYDYKLAEYDLYHSIIHVGALAKAGILSKDEEAKLIFALRRILSEVEQGTFKPDLKCEDIHSDIQNRVAAKVGRLSFKLHTLRSRNDQIVFDEKMYCLSEAEVILRLLENLFAAFIDKAGEYKNSFFIGYTHTRRAQVIYFRDYILAYSRMFKRDYRRLSGFMKNLDVSIGAAALTGSSLKAEYYQNSVIPSVMKKYLKTLDSALDVVSSRDFLAEFLSVLSITQMHLSRFAEDGILYSTKEFDFFDLPEEFCTGSSLMPHKKNPDFLELVRGYSGIVYGNLIAVLTTMKGLPLAYNRDMQLNKEPLFSSVDILKNELKIMAKFVKGITLKKSNIAAALEDESLYATEIAEFLVIEKAVAFSVAHNIVGRLIRYAEDSKQKIKDLPDKVLSKFHSSLNREQLKVIMCPEYAAQSKKSFSLKVPKLK